MWEARKFDDRREKVSGNLTRYFLAGWPEGMALDGEGAGEMIFRHAFQIQHGMGQNPFSQRPIRWQDVHRKGGLARPFIDKPRRLQQSSRGNSSTIFWSEEWVCAV